MKPCPRCGAENWEFTRECSCGHRFSDPGASKGVMPTSVGEPPGEEPQAATVAGKPSVQELQAAESRLTSAFVLAAVAAGCGVGAGVWLRNAEEHRLFVWVVYLIAELFLVIAYVWYATAIGRAATYVVPSPWKYILWVLVAPFLALIPIPIVSTLIAASPLSLKFFFGGQLRSEIRERLLAE